MKHKHHIVPRHAGGTNDSSNIIEVTVEEHAELHRKLWFENGRWQDEMAWKCLSGLIGREEAQKEACRRANIGKIPSAESKEKNRQWHLGRRYSQETKEKHRQARLGWVWDEAALQKMRKPKSTTVNMKGPKSETHRENMRKGRQGLRWWNNGLKEVRRVDCPSSEWKPGLIGARNKGRTWKKSNA